MALPVNIEDLLQGQVVEWERLEFKRGWNPEEVIHTMCAFANDLHNWGGGYIVIGVAEEAGQAVFPPTGIDPKQMDTIQGEVISLANQLQPNYFPRMQPYVKDGQHILVLWCPAGDHRPYSAPSTQGKASQRQYYIRYGSRSIVAKGENLQRLIELTARIPFDDRINRQATIDDFDLGLIQAFLQEVKSSLYEESQKMPLAEIARSMHIAKGPDEDLYPVNVGLLFFNRTPEVFFPRTWIELVVHQDDSGRAFKEHYFKGPLHVQLRDCLSFLKSNIIHEQVIKVPNQAEALRFFNFPYNGSPEPVFETDDQSTYFLTVLPSLINISNGASNGAQKSVQEVLNTEVHDRVSEMLSLLSEYITRQHLFDNLNLTNQSKNRAKYLDPLLKCGWVEQEFPEETTHPNQRYRITKAGKRILELINFKN